MAGGKWSSLRRRQVGTVVYTAETVLGLGTLPDETGAVSDKSVQVSCLPWWDPHGRSKAGSQEATNVRACPELLVAQLALTAFTTRG